MTIVFPLLLCLVAVMAEAFVPASVLPRSDIFSSPISLMVSLSGNDFGWGVSGFNETMGGDALKPDTPTKKKKKKFNGSGMPAMNPLDEMNAIWELQWESKFQELAAFKAKHGDCLVPLNWEENPELACWVCCQRNLYHKNDNDPTKLSDSKISMLNLLGFEWNFLEQMK